MKIKFSYIMLILALLVAGCAAYFSVWGLSQLFAGASTAVIIMASALEIGKIVTTTALHNYWDSLARGLKVYLTISVGILMFITSAGIYGFLSNAYQSTANKLELHEGELSILEAKKQSFEKMILDNNKIIETKTKRIDQLNNLRTNQETRLDNSVTNRNQKNARRDIENSDKQIQLLNSEVDILNNKNIILSDSVNGYNVKTIELKSGSEIAGEIGPLKYISELTDTPMANVVNYMILLLIFVFDPLAVALILATNKVFEIESKKKINPLVETPTTIVEVIKDKSNNIKVDEKTGEIDLPKEDLEIKQDYFISTPNTEEEKEQTLVEPLDIAFDDSKTEGIEQKTKREPVIPTGKVNLEDIKEIKEGNRGFSVNIPNPKANNTVERIGSNKVIKNGDNNKIFFKRK